MMKKINLLSCFIFLFISNCIWGQTFIATTEYTSVPLNQSFDVVYELKGAKADRFIRPDFEPFRVISQQSYSGGGMTVIINNKVVQDGSGSQKWVFTLLPTSTGKYTIGPAKVLVGNDWLESNSITINVTPSGSPTTASAPAPPTQSKSNKPDTDRSKLTNPVVDDEIFLKAEVSKSNVYLGEPIILDYYIYTRVDVRQFGINKTPSFKGFWSENLLDNTANVKTTEKVINGKRYIVAHIRSIALYPQEIGKLKVDPLEVEAIIVRHVAHKDPFDLFGDFFKDPFNFDPFNLLGPSVISQPQKITLKSNPVVINVKPLPKGAPESFSNAVGNFKIDAFLDNDRCFAGESIIYNLKISGTGNLPLLSAPELNLPENFQVFEPEIKDAFSKTSKGIAGSRTFKYIITPLKAGNYTIPSVEFSYFSPTLKKYITVNTPELNIQVFDAVGSKGAQATIVNLKDDIQYINPIKNLTIFNKLPHNNLFVILMFFIPLLIMIIISIFYRKRLKILTDFTLQKQKRADREARKRLKTAHKYMKENNAKLFFDQLLLALWQFISDKYLIPLSNLNIDSAREVMINHNIDESIIEELLSFIKECQMYAYAPTDTNDNLEKFYKRAYEFIRKKI
ncbi:MAG TPA: BatD family protein [Bacteroidales bacterium]|nr:BatD family protein [Bacteroidales bacterium]HQD59480.1 BatD family protein [Bacteroidales bacterium]